MTRLDQLFEQFLRERTYVNNVTTATCEWYQCAWKAFTVARKSSQVEVTSAALITKAAHRQRQCFRLRQPAVDGSR
jgi:hypothetical protein